MWYLMSPLDGENCVKLVLIYRSEQVYSIRFFFYICCLYKLETVENVNDNKNYFNYNLVPVYSGTLDH